MMPDHLLNRCKESVVTLVASLNAVPFKRLP